MTVTALVRSVHGLEWLAADELDELLGPEPLGPEPLGSEPLGSGQVGSGQVGAAPAIRLARRQLALPVRPEELPRLLGLSCADDVLVAVGEVLGGAGGQPVDALAGRLPDLDWEPVLDAVRSARAVPDRPGVDVVAAVSGVRRWSRFAVEQAAGPVLARRLGGRYLERGPLGRAPGRAGLTVRLDVSAERTGVALRLAELPLHRRAYKQDTGPGTLHPPVAAAMARLALPPGSDGSVGSPGSAGESGEAGERVLTVLDPFCGDGTVAVEAALRAACTGVPAEVRGSDLDPVRVANARANAARAGVVLDLAVRDATASSGPVDLLLGNPPWNLAVDPAGRLAGGLDPFWRGLPDLLAGGGRVCLLTDQALDVPALLAGAGFEVLLRPGLRLAGRLVHLVLADPPVRSSGTPAGAGREPLPARAAAWRQRAISAGVTTAAGF